MQRFTYFGLNTKFKKDARVHSQDLKISLPDVK